MTETTLFVLNSKGDLKLTWDHTDPAEVEKMRKEVEGLRKAGYAFFLVDGSPADEVAAGQGVLNAVRVDAEVLLAPAAGDPAVPDQAASSTRGRKAVAVPQQRGG